MHAETLEDVGGVAVHPHQLFGEQQVCSGERLGRAEAGGAAAATDGPGRTSVGRGRAATAGMKPPTDRTCSGGARPWFHNRLA